MVEYKLMGTEHPRTGAVNLWIRRDGESMSMEEVVSDLLWLQEQLHECRRLLRFVIDHGIRTTDGTKTVVWQHEWEEFLVGVENAKGGGDE